MNIKKVQALFIRGRSKVIATTSLACLAIGAAMAQETTGGGDGLDYSTSVTAFKTDMTSFFTTNGPALLGALVVMLAFGIVWKLVKRAAKSV
ncbi:MAG: hypothetical protein BGO01_07890 [Armatimonadetes bacterium 55-13]|nr:hypothetical protein [Armatimonadota bacterium]OJU62396.1 MAG: hypothetical protein BGO01_07890 [Armatimonadetes bacterium 55-13]